MRYALLSFFISMLLAASAFASQHPGNIFLAGEDVQLNVPDSWTGWKAFDVDGKQIAESDDAQHKANLGKLPVGYFEIRRTGGTEKIRGGVVAKNAPVENTPIAIDAAMSWLYGSPDQIRDACVLCRLGGVNWVRDRASWPELEPKRGQWAQQTRYERTMQIEHEEGLKILQVNHISPPWASKNSSHFPEDLRDVYNFYHEIALRWKGLADAIEPWNEPDIMEFGGQTGCEIASFQKAAALALKAGNPQLPINQTVFAIDRPETLDEYGLNDVAPYFDRYDMHIYVRFPDYARAYGRHRAVSGGRPIWTTEFNLTVHWADEKTKEPSDDELLVQSYRVGKVFSHALYQGAEKAFYFMLGDYSERNLQYGIIHKDLTPRPAYIAFAAAGRLLNGAVPIGRIDLGNDKLFGYAFTTQVDGSPSETLVLWSETNPTTIEVPAADKSYDCFGRELSNPRSLHLSRTTLFAILPPGGSKTFKITPPPAKPKWLDGKASPVVLQLLGPTDFKKSAFVLDDKKQLRLIAYNFADKPMHGELRMTGAAGPTGALEIPAGGKSEQTIQVASPGNVTARFTADDGTDAIVSANAIDASQASK